MCVYAVGGRAVAHHRNALSLARARQRRVVPRPSLPPAHSAHPTLPTLPLVQHELLDEANGIPGISSIYRFAGMPFPQGSPDGANYFSYSAGPVHVISLASFFEGGFGANSRMTAFLKADLAAIDRAATPWVIVSLHAPWYNSNSKVRRRMGFGGARRFQPAPWRPLATAARALDRRPVPPSPRSITPSRTPSFLRAAPGRGRDHARRVRAAARRCGRQRRLRRARARV